jgi:hypothetical protein
MEVNVGNNFEHLGNTTKLCFPPLQRERALEVRAKSFATSPLPRNFATDLFQVSEDWSIVVE